MNITVPVVLHQSWHRDGESHQVNGAVPYESCPLAVTPAVTFDHVQGHWREVDGYCITHRRTGLKLRNGLWPSVAEAMNVLNRCQPEFPAWASATGVPKCAATTACFAYYRAAVC